MSSRDPYRRPRAQLALVLALVLLGALGAWPPGAGGSDPVVGLFWLALLAPAAGALTSGLGVGPLPFGWLVPALWTVPVLWAAAPPRTLATPLWAVLAWSGLFLVGAALGAAARRRGAGAWAASGLALLLAGTLALLPARAAAGARPWPVASAAALLDLSPSALVIESAGVDWMRHASVYDPVGTDRFARRPFRGALAGPVALVLGCVLVAASRLVPLRGGRHA